MPETFPYHDDIMYVHDSDFQQTVKLQYQEMT